MKRRIKSLLLYAVRVFVLLGLCLWLFQGYLIYHPRSYSSAEIAGSDVLPLEYSTAQGKQVAWLSANSTATAERVWLVFAGNGSLALDFAGYFNSEALKDDAFVYVDYPSYGSCAGRPSPEAIRDSIRVVVPAIAQKLRISTDALKSKLRVFGHSLGTAAALIAMEEHDIKGGGLVAPFTSMLDMSYHTVGWPLCETLRHRFNNVARLDALSIRPGVRVTILHGTADEVIPVSMGKSLGDRYPGIVAFTAVQNGRHNDIIHTDRNIILQAMTSVR